MGVTRLVTSHLRSTLGKEGPTDRQTDRPTDRQTDRPTKPPVGRPSGSGKHWYNVEKNDWSIVNVIYLFLFIYFQLYGS